MQSRLWQKLRTLIFFWLFLDMTKNKNELRGWICGCSSSKPWKSDTKMIWGGPIFSWAARWWWWQRMIIGDNLVSPMNSPRLNPDANATALKPCRIFTGPRHQVVWAPGGSPRPLLLATFVFWQNRNFWVFSWNYWSSEILFLDGPFSSRILTPVVNSPIIIKHAK
jgi:hypothetical protein